jgi:hypothetical protein
MSTLRTNTLEGVDAKNSITIVAGAGNVTTTNVQEGLCKAWVNFDGTGTIATRDSQNISGLTDGGTGIYAIAYTSSFNNDDYSYQIHGTNSSSGGITKLTSASGSITTSDIDVQSLNAAQSAYQDNDDNSVSIHGDLA